ncbi:hypothetical protein AB1N83_009738 [Pleurotus pulmonarius]
MNSMTCGGTAVFWEPQLSVTDCKYPLYLKIYAPAIQLKRVENGSGTIPISASLPLARRLYGAECHVVARALLWRNPNVLFLHRRYHPPSESITLALRLKASSLVY